MSIVVLGPWLRKIDHLASTLIVSDAGETVVNSAGEPDTFPATGGILVAAPQHSAELYGMWKKANADTAGN